MKKLLRKNPLAGHEYAWTSAAMIAVFIVAVVLINAIIYRLATKYEWYFYTEERYSYEVDTERTDRLFSSVSSRENVTIIFCQMEEQLTDSWETRLVYETAMTLADRYDFISVETVSIWANPDRIKKYRTAQDGTKVSIGTSSVIVDSGKDFTILDMRDFYVLDDSDYIMCYDGAERMCASVMWTLADSHPTAYFTSNHGETSTESFYYMLTFSGYNVRSIDLYRDDLTGEDSILVIANPIYDFEKAAEGSSYLAEIDKIERFVSSGGSVFVLLDGRSQELRNLYAMLTRCGMTVSNSTVRDTSGSITIDGYTITTVYADNDTASAIASTVADDEGRIVMRNASPIVIGDAAGYTAYPILLSNPGASEYSNGVSVGKDGSYPVAAMSVSDRGGKVFLVAAERFATHDTIETNSYANEEFIYAVIEQLGGRMAPSGFDLLVLDTEALEDMTRGEANLWAVIFIAVVPAAVAVAGSIVCIRRRHR